MFTALMMNGEMPSAFATAAAPSTNTSLDQANAKRPPDIKTADSQNGMSVYTVTDYLFSGSLPLPSASLPKKNMPTTVATLTPIMTMSFVVMTFPIGEQDAHHEHPLQ